MVEAVGGAAASVRSVNATAIATALPIHTSRNVSAEARELEPPLLAGAGFLALPLPAPPFGFGLLPFPMVKTQVYRYLAVKTVGGHFSGATVIIYSDLNSTYRHISGRGSRWLHAAEVA